MRVPLLVENAGVVQHLAAGRVDDQVVAVGQRDEHPLLVGPAVELVLLDVGPVAGREGGVVQHLAAGRVDDVIGHGGGVTRRQQLPLLVDAAVGLVLIDRGPVAGRGGRVVEDACRYTR